MSSEELDEFEESTPGISVPGLDWSTAEDLQKSEYHQDNQRLGNHDQLKVLPKHGFCLWPEDGDDWIHPSDILIAKTLIPSKRIFRKEYSADPIHDELGYIVYVYGNKSFRGKQTLWHEVKSDGYEIGDTVELKSSHGKLRPVIADIDGMFWNRHEQAIDYSLVKNGVPQPNRFQAGQFRLCMKIGVPPTPRQKALLNRESSLNGL
jgi:hypothetical protein